MKEVRTITNGTAVMEVRLEMRPLLCASVLSFNLDADHDDIWDCVLEIKDMEPAVIMMDQDVESDLVRRRPLLLLLDRMGFDTDGIWAKYNRGNRSLETELRAVEETLAREFGAEWYRDYLDPDGPGQIL